ncbi:MAG: OmpH family outer membrane protein [Paludibacteraceae bacterium]|nr:OmpH family outer membrane protein [Paludibacteraceae bacterium]
MKKMILMLALALPIIASAQKIGHVNSQEIMALMPETKQMGEKLDSVQGVYETQLANMQEEFNKKVAEFQQQQQTMSASILEYKQQELAQMEQRLQMFYQTIQKDLQAKQVEYLQPIRDKLLATINKVATAQACTYVMDQANMLYIAPDALDLTSAVKAELGIK